MKEFKSFRGKKPQIDESCFVAEGVALMGDVIMEAGSNIWFNAVARGDVNTIEIGENTNVQDLSMLHVTEKDDLRIGKNVSIGHSVVLHGCKIEDSCLIGMGSKILDGAVIGEGSLVAAGSLVPPGKVFPPRSYIMGFPAKRLRDLTEQEYQFISNHYRSYLGYKDEFIKEGYGI